MFKSIGNALKGAVSGAVTWAGSAIGGAIGASLVSPDAVTGSDAFASLPIVGGLAGKGSLDFGTDQFFMGGKPLGLPGQSLDQISQNIISSRGLNAAQAQAQGLTPLGLEQAGARLGANILQKQGVKPLEILKDSPPDSFPALFGAFPLVVTAPAAIAFGAST